MKFRYAIVLIVAVLLVGGSALMAVGLADPTIRANVPFAFRVGNEFMPAGQYKVTHINTRYLLMIRSVDTQATILVHSVPSGKDAGDSAKLVFNRYGETYFLRQVWIPGTDANELLWSKTEKEYASRWSGPERATVVGVTEK